MLRDTTAATWGSVPVPWLVWPELGSLSSTWSRTRSFQKAGMGEFYVLVAGRLCFPRRDMQGCCLCVLSPAGWRGGCASEQGTRFPNDPCEPQSSWKRRAELHWWENGNLPGGHGPGCSFQGCIPKNKHPDLIPGLRGQEQGRIPPKGSCLAGSSRRDELDEEDSACGRSWMCLDLHLAPLLQHETDAVRLK